MSPADMEDANPNWVGGDIYAGSCALDQNLLFRPTPATPGHGTRSRTSGTSARAPIPARASAPAPATSWPSTSRARRWVGGCSRGFRGVADALAE